MTPEPSRFDDPGLKAAVRRTWGGRPPRWSCGDGSSSTGCRTDSRAGGEPTQTRDPPSPRVLARQRRRSPRWPRRRWWCVGVGLLAFKTQSRRAGRRRSSTLGRLALSHLCARHRNRRCPTELGAQIVRGHDPCTRLHPRRPPPLHRRPQRQLTRDRQGDEGQVEPPGGRDARWATMGFRGASCAPWAARRPT